MKILRTISGSSLTPTGLLETEQGLVMFLLLYGQLSYRGTRLSRWALAAVGAGILLSIFTPVHQIDLFWPVLTALIVPPLLPTISAENALAVALLLIILLREMLKPLVELIGTELSWLTEQGTINLRGAFRCRKKKVHFVIQ
jgi:hypothetical protein